MIQEKFKLTDFKRLHWIVTSITKPLDLKKVISYNNKNNNKHYPETLTKAQADSAGGGASTVASKNSVLK